MENNCSNEAYIQNYFGLEVFEEKVAPKCDLGILTDLLYGFSAKQDAIIAQLTKKNAELTEENGRLRAENEQWRELDSRNRGYSFDDTEQ